MNDKLIGAGKIDCSKQLKKETAKTCFQGLKIIFYERIISLSLRQKK